MLAAPAAARFCFVKDELTESPQPLRLLEEQHVYERGLVGMGADRPPRSDGDSDALAFHERGALTPESNTQDGRVRIERLEQVDRWLDLVEQLPLGHPDRFRFLTFAEQILET
jgi:hypothetical protein